MQGGCSGVCSLGTCDSSFFGFLGNFLVFSALETWISFGSHHIVTAIMYEGNKAYKTGPEKETKDASSIINVETLNNLISPPPQLSLCKLQQILTISTVYPLSFLVYSVV